MAPETPPSHTQAELSALAMELDALRDLLVTLSLALTDIQFESDTALRSAAISQTDQLLQACRTRPG